MSLCLSVTKPSRVLKNPLGWSAFSKLPIVRMFILCKYVSKEGKEEAERLRKRGQNPGGG